MASRQVVMMRKWQDGSEWLTGCDTGSQSPYYTETEPFHAVQETAARLTEGAGQGGSRRSQACVHRDAIVS